MSRFKFVIALPLVAVLSPFALPDPAAAQAPQGTSQTVSQTATTQQTPPEQLPRIRLERMFKVDRPTDAVCDPTGRFFFVEQTGHVLQYENGKLSDTPFLDLSKKTYVEYECGLLDIVFHPKFAENGYVYASYTSRSPKLKSVVAEYHADPKSNQVDVSTERVVLTVDQEPFTNHKGGQLKFGPDGYLYYSLGDGGGQKDQLGNGQNPKALRAKILRIDVTPREGYAVPKDNPFVGNNDFAPEIWAWGFRNPWRFSFDPETKLMYEADVGQDDWEEINIVQKGGNYGWSLREGAHDFHPKPGAPKTIDPIFEYYHNKTAASVTGGYVYRGKKIPQLVGWYVFADYSQGTVYGLKYENGRVTASGILIDPRNPQRNGGQRPTQASSFAVDPEGELYLLDANGPVYRVVGEK